MQLGRFLRFWCTTICSCVRFKVDRGGGPVVLALSTLDEVQQVYTCAGHGRASGSPVVSIVQASRTPSWGRVLGAIVFRDPVAEVVRCHRQTFVVFCGRFCVPC